MHSEKDFLIQLRNDINQLKTAPTNDIIDKIKKLILDNTALFDETTATASFIDSLITSSSTDIKDVDVDALVITAALFWEEFFARRPIDILLFCTPDKVSPFKKRLGSDKYNLLIFNEHNKISNINDYQRPFVVYDNEFRQLIKYKQFYSALGCYYLQHNAVSKDLFDICTIGHLDLLNLQYKKVISDLAIENVILGSSYSCHAFPESLLINSVNLSLPNGDFSFAYTLINDIAKKRKNTNYIMLVGYFNLFHEISKGRGAAFPIANVFCEENNIEHIYNKNEEKKYPAHLIALQNDELFLKASYYDDSRWNILIKQLKESRFDKKRMQSSINKIKDIGMSVDFNYSKSAIEQRAYDLSKNYNHQESYEINQQLVHSMLESIAGTDSKIYFVIPPFPSLFIKQLHQEMVIKTKTFFEHLQGNKNIAYYDFSSLDGFIPDDYIDTDHLNFNGAKKLKGKLKEIDINL